jgi:hypothetical protein
MAYSQTDLDTIDAAIATGELEVVIDGKKVHYRTIDELMKARAFIAGQLASSGGNRRSVFYFTPAGRRD